MAALALLALCSALAAPPAAAVDLYSEKTFRPLASDKRAHLPGDVLTILIVESSSAVTSADTSLNRRTDASVQVRADRHEHSAGVAAGSTYDGGGTVQRAGKLLAQMSVTIAAVADNGDLLVAGEQLLEINADKQKIRVEGRVRPLDISDTNTVLSFRLADAKISYLGDGELASRQRPGFWSKLFNWAGF
ncbi:flagellar basal body L-ring protein FlgH [Pseudoduganella ginsengisoli]|uniref:Flagellar basal body L-ring protein FlgH n=2 Tax=Pseudoduganella ginsengisoli TaxID=1462440 RepID=A0A6L6Q906_9BURK|nr:flagellar basal body L-ring protein FlgH [Pseudoduganella ginsengisoli]